jgi:hypothetical protein
MNLGRWKWNFEQRRITQQNSKMREQEQAADTLRRSTTRQNSAVRE